MILTRTHRRIFHTSAELQHFLLSRPAGVLILVPQMRLAHQVWRQQRLANQAAGQTAWEPVAMTTLSGWCQQLWRRLWLPLQPATVWQRLMFLLQAMETTPPAKGVAADLSWAALLDEAYDLIRRYRLPPPTGPEADSPLIIWRQSVNQKFTTLLREHRLITTASLPDFLHEALTAGRLTLPEQIVLVGLETPDPTELAWLQAIAASVPVTEVSLAGRGEEELRLEGVTFPDRRQEMEWVAAQVLELAHDRDVPLHRLAVTAPNLESYLPDLRRLWRELLGPAATDAGGYYNFSLGPTLADTRLFAAARLPLTFVLGGESRLDLTGWLRSPFYGAFSPHDKMFLRWDAAWRKSGTSFGWTAMRDVPAQISFLNSAPSERGDNADDPATEARLLGLIDQALATLPRDQAPAALWQSRLLELWQVLQFPRCLEPEEVGQWQACLNLLRDFVEAAGNRLWTAAHLVEWLSWGAARLDLPGDGTMDAGIQIQGLLELRGLDFEAVFCLGLNMGVFPPPPRQLPLLTSREKAAVLGGDYQSQEKFAETSYRYLLAAAPHLVLTRPRFDQEEEQLASYLIPPTVWKKEPMTFNPLSRPDPAWLRSPAVQAAFLTEFTGLPENPPERIEISLPKQLSLSALETALTCPCRFYLNTLLKLGELPDPEPGLTPPARGTAIHEVLHDFTSRFQVLLKQDGYWDDHKASRLLREVVLEYRPPVSVGLHWEAEINRWLEGEEALLVKWLGQEKQRFLEGWRWHAMEENFAGLKLAGWPTEIKGRPDRLDSHESLGVMIWDYKTGEVPGRQEMITQPENFQLAGYLLAIQQGLLNLPGRPEARAGVIGLKSSRDEHFKFEDFRLSAEDWRELLAGKLLAVTRLGALVSRGDFRPVPSQPPPSRNNSCQFCPFQLLCGYHPDEGAAADE